MIFMVWNTTQLIGWQLTQSSDVVISFQVLLIYKILYSVIIYIMPVWLTWIFIILIFLGIFARISLSIYQKFRQIQGKKNKKKELEKRDDRK